MPTNGDASLTLKETPIENQRPLSVVVVGAGYSGIYTAIRLIQRLKNVEVNVYEQNEGVGGVWWVNRYPGVACDIPSYSYQYSFAPNPYWSSLYAPGSEIRAYLDDVATRFGAKRYIKTCHEVQRCVWDGETKTWDVKVKNLVTGLTFNKTANLLVSARGGLNDISWPKIDGLWDFKGKLMHSAAWDESVDLRNKRVGVIGNGSSAIQIVPKVRALEGVKLWSFARSPTWIAARFGDNAMMKLGLDVHDTQFSREHQERMARHPGQYYKMRKVIETDSNMAYPIVLRGTEMQLAGKEMFERDMKQRLKTRPDLFKVMIPSFAPGCRRLTPGPGYLESLGEDNVTVVNTAIGRITETGVQLASGENIELEALICATGFSTDAPPTFEVVGKGGMTLGQRWRPYMESYISVAVDGFPNFLMVGGPNSGVGVGSLTIVLESAGDYVVKVVRKMQKEDYASIEPKAQRVADFSAIVDEYFKRTVFSDECSSWYRGGRRSGRIVALWPGSTPHCLEALRAPRWEDYDYEPVPNEAGSTSNALRWMGNGWSQTQVDGDPSWYLDEGAVDVPEEGRPEEAAMNRLHPYSH
ncbi:FAD/NAD(P)-binding domain-containing protein [Pleurostoma richardsiae]|uniref:FAD/NAD(P)-binding domain-containing protein n=1 Tax=Pleurostoma richardsiae TaxID=41990 RepID=A0AA38VPT7_9PEZI|nr:FAD/NAD(P)-binding domain-containing protein [Pleurostoma richardsiae]